MMRIEKVWNFSLALNFFEIFFPFVTLYSEKKLKFSFYHTSKYLTLVSFAMFQSPAPSIGTEKEAWSKERGMGKYPHMNGQW